MKDYFLNESAPGNDERELITINNDEIGRLRSALVNIAKRIWKKQTATLSGVDCGCKIQITPSRNSNL
jgi:hypothetical protein